MTLRFPLLVASLLLSTLTSQPQTLSRTADAVVLLAIGKVDYQTGDNPEWLPAERGRTLLIGDKIRTGPASKATLRFSDLTVLRLKESTELTVSAPETRTEKFGITLDSGSTYMKSRAQPREILLRTRTVSGAIRGTEFVFTVDANGRTLLTLLDGEVELQNAHGQVVLTGGEQGLVDPGQAPTKRAALETINIIQWTLYYPGVIDPDELELDDAFQDSLAAYKQGDLLDALAQYPAQRIPESDAEKIYHAALFLAVGDVDQTESLLSTLTARSPWADALEQLIAAVKFRPWTGPPPAASASSWMADSYYQQSRSNLEAALASARRAAELAPQFGFAWIRVGELEFSFGRGKAALAAAERGLALSPRHAEGFALMGFLLSSQNRFDAARDTFEQAIVADGSLANGWLGRGLIRIRQGDRDGGLQDLLVAAALEPNRAVLRSYLGKAFSYADQGRLAERELERAEALDPNDPTASLYSALLHQRGNRLNQAVRELERSRDLNDNRSVYRSRFLLDQDQAVRRANLAQIYQDLGMVDVSAREAARAVQSDYANYSAHLFLANSFDLLRDPNQVNLRYETPWLSEYLVANLLAPAGVGALSSAISQQEYARLFDRRRLGVVSATEYLSRGAWLQTGSQYGLFDRSSYAVEVNYRTDNGQRANQNQEQLTLSAQFKQQVTAKDTLYLQATYFDFEAGDLVQYYDPAMIHKDLEIEENQEPLLLLGWHREWSPASHTLLLAGRLQDTFSNKDPAQDVLLGTAAGNAFTPLATINANFDYESELEIYTVELQHIWQHPRHNFIVGGRYQDGDFDTESRQTMPSALGFLFPGGVLADQDFNNDFRRISAYAYENVRVLEPLLLTLGVSYDRIDYPENYRNTPINNSEQSRDRLSPKAGLFWTPTRHTTVRGTYTRSLGGVSFDQSFQLEPTQIGGFNQAYRSLIPESVVGAAAVPTFETWGVGLDQKFPTDTYLGVEAQLLKSDVKRTVGVYAATFAPPGATAFDLDEELEYEERSLAVNAHQLLGDFWAAGGRYRVAKAELTDRFEQVAGGTTDSEAILHQLNLFLLCHLPSGWFARADALWYSQDNKTSAMPGDDFWQFNALAGYRFRHRRAEVRAGLLNINDQDYRLNPLNLYNELPRHRTFVASLRFNF